MTTISEKKTRSISRSEKSVQKRDEIVRMATEIINAKSYAQATLVDIAAALNLRDATLYHYFPDKRALAYECHRTSLERFEKLLHLPEQPGSLGGDKLRHFIRNMLTDSVQNGPLLYFGDYSYLHAPQRQEITEWAQRLRNRLVKILREGMADGSLTQSEPELVVHLLLGMLIWLSKWVPAIDSLTVDRLMSAIDAFCFRGLEARHRP
ncbi:MAG: AcrR family transcriptional regulator [Bradyrhizobium sp.]|jgi:AcrR family transcriptional regulator